ncbi:hypothetical protein BJ322DRAFT_1111025 [Thelephora terrestris]|uniref:SH3 domain-containing protein n=1 Tax=Thelephora terrestris TaxID=56493 RepID=A0A9P6HAH7_9AGAM|nr:hypothetical protein BJ322DRAFT_1111025 [Thelephora terrestris]
MVFSQLSAHEKNAFFSLLDEYFTSRPDLLSNIAKSQAVDSAANAAHDALKNPATRKAALDTFKSGVSSARTNWNATQEAGPEPTDEGTHNGPGRVAAAAASLMSHPRFGGSPTPTSTGPPKPPARRVADDSNSPPLSTNKPPIQRRESSSLTTTRKFGGDVDLTSAKGFFTSVRGPSKNQQQPLANPSSFLPPSGIQKKQFAPPPVRRIASDSSPTSATSTSTLPPPPPPRKKEEPAGEWAEVLYDFSGDPGDLDVKESQRVLIVERSSDDWWTAELDGNRGLVPASYVKIL